MKKSVFLLFLLFCKSFAELDREWWRHTMIYEILPFSYKDSDGDGIGDIKGITSKLDHLSDLQIEAIHLTPMFKTSMRDMGYDITDYYQIDPRYGTMDDFDELMRELRKRDIKLILDLVINHSGHKNEWFLKSIDRIDPYTDYYMWRDPKEINGVRIPPNNWRNLFQWYDLGSAWTWNEKRQQYYLHQFLPEQPDFDLSNENVKKELKKIITFWLDKGVAGFRLDAAPHFFEDKEMRDDDYDSRQKDQPETFDFIHEFRLFLDEYNNKHGGFERIYLAEAHSHPVIVAQYYGNKTYPMTHFPYNFILEYITRPLNAFYLYYYIDSWNSFTPKGEITAWMFWDRQTYLDSSMRHKIMTITELPLELYPNKYSDLITMISMMLPGTVCVYYGQEIGMTNGFITPAQIRDYSGNGGRDPARLLMQWDDSMNAGFSINETTFLPPNSDYFTRNVELQKNDESSHYNMFKDLSALRKTDTLKKGKFTHWSLFFEDIYVIKRSYEGHECYLLVNCGQSLLKLNVTETIQNPPNEVSIVAVSTNSGYKSGFIVDRESLNKFSIRPLSGIIFETFHPRPKNEDDTENYQDS